MLSQAVPAQALTVWRIQPAPAGGLDTRRNLFLDSDGGFAALTRSVGSGVFTRSQHWAFRHLGGTIPQALRTGLQRRRPGLVCTSA